MFIFINNIDLILTYSCNANIMYVKEFRSVLWIIFKEKKMTSYYCLLCAVMRKVKWDFYGRKTESVWLFHEPSMASTSQVTWIS